MFDKPDSLRSIGLELDGSTLRAVEIHFVKGKAKLNQTFELNEEISTHIEAVKPLYMYNEGLEISKTAKSNLIVTILKSSEVLVRSLDVKLKKMQDIDSVLSFQCEPLLPYPVENAIIDRIPLSQTEEGTKLTVLATRKDYLQKHLQIWNILEINPEIVTCVPAALASFSKLFFASPDAHLILHVGVTETTCALIKNSELLAAQSIPLGIQELKNELSLTDHAETLNAIDFSTVGPDRFPELQTLIKDLRLEITRTFYSLLKSSKNQVVTNVLFLGEGANLLNLDQLLSQDLNLQFFPPELNPNFALTSQELQRFAVPIGSALSTLPTETPIDFRQDEFIYPNQWKRLKKPLIFYYILCSLLAFSIYLLSLTYIEKEKNAVRQEYVTLLASMNKPYAIFEKEYLAKHPNEQMEGDSELSPKLLSMEQISARMQTLQNEIITTPDIFPLLPNTPKVSDVLAWLSSHPIVNDKTQQVNGNPTLQIDHFSYTLVKRPELKKKQERYQVKVEIEFTTQTPKIAREFHDALIAPNDFIDPKGEVKWSSSRGKYRATFFLKDRTAYSAIKAEGGGS